MEEFEIDWTCETVMLIEHEISSKMKETLCQIYKNNKS